MSQMNPKTFLHNTTFSVQLPYIAGHSLNNKDLKIFGFDDLKVKMSNY